MCQANDERKTQSLRRPNPRNLLVLLAIENAMTSGSGKLGGRMRHAVEQTSKGSRGGTGTTLKP